MGINKYKKSITFDLDTKSLQEYYPNNKDWHNAYNEIERFFIKHNFSHRQGSGYVSNEELTDSKIAALMKLMNNTFTWLKYCINEFDVANIGKQYSLKHIFKENTKKNVENENTSKEHKSHKRKR